MPKDICFISANPEFLGGISTFQNNLIRYIKKEKTFKDIFWIYQGEIDKKYNKNGVNYVSLSGGKIPYLNQIVYNFRLANYLKKNRFSIINTHASTIFWTNLYKKEKFQKIIATFHGSTYFFLKNSISRFNLIKRLPLNLMLLFGFLADKPSKKSIDSIISVSDKVKRDLIKLYGLKSNISVIRTGVDLKKFKVINRQSAKKRLNLDDSNFYGLYVGRGGYWTKGLDRTLSISLEMHKMDPKYKLLVIGADMDKVKKFITEDVKKFAIFLPPESREKMPLYYSSAEVFFCMSRYEGGAPTLVVSEAMASGCLVVCSKSSEQEIIVDGFNGLIINCFDKKDAKKIFELKEDSQYLKKVIFNSRKTVSELTLENWGKKYLNVLLK